MQSSLEMNREVSVQMAREIVSKGILRQDRVNIAVFSLISSCAAIGIFIAGMMVGQKDLDVVRAESQHVIETAKLMREKCG